MPYDALERLKDLIELSKLGGGRERIEQQHRKGKLTARERIELLMDEGSFHELDRFAVHQSTDFGMDKKKYLGDGVITGYGTVNGRLTFVYAHDFTVFGGSIGEIFGKKIAKVMDLAIKVGAPIVGLNDSGGARIQEGVSSLIACSEIFYRNTIASGVIPQIVAIMGPCAGAAVYSPALMDFIIMVKNSFMFVTGPEVVKAALGQEVSFEELGGAMIHAKESGIAHFIANDDAEAIDLIKRLLSYLPQNNSEEPPLVDMGDDPNRTDKNLLKIVPPDPYKPYDMREVIRSVLDGNEFFEVQGMWAKNLIIGFGRLNSMTVGVVANQPLYLAGVLDINSSNKAARFVRFCDAFNIPIITFVDVPGYLPGTEQERGGIIKHGSKLLFAYSEATVPKITVIIRKAYGGAYCAMGSKYSKADINLAWPTAEIAVMGPESAVRVLYRKQLKRMREEGMDTEEIVKRIVKEYKERFANPYVAAEKGIIDDVINPEETRPVLIKALEMLKDKREARPLKKHGNIQL